MSAFSSRTTGYKFGVLFLGFSFIVFLIGYAAPFWRNTDWNLASQSYSLRMGLWMVCTEVKSIGLSVSSCTTLGVTGLAGWFQAVRGLNSICFIGLVISCVYSMAVNCCRAEPGPRTRILEVLAACSGLLGFAGCMLYVGFLSDEDSNSADDTYFSGLGIILREFGNINFDWAFYMASIGSGLSFVAAIIIGICNKVVLPPTTHHGGGTVIAMQNYNQGQVQGQVQGYPGYYGQPQQGYGYGYPAAAGPVKAGY